MIPLLNPDGSIYGYQPDVIVPSPKITAHKRAALNTTQNLLAASYTPINFNTVLIDNNDEGRNPAAPITLKSSGIYMLESSVYLLNAGYAAILPIVNGVMLNDFIGDQLLTGSGTVSGTYMMPLNAGDTLAAAIYTSVINSIVAYPEDMTRLSVFKVV